MDFETGVVTVVIALLIVVVLGLFGDWLEDRLARWLYRRWLAKHGFRIQWGGDNAHSD